MFIATGRRVVFGSEVLPGSRRKQVVTTSVAPLALSLGENKQAFWEVCLLSFFNVPLILLIMGNARAMGPERDEF